MSHVRYASMFGAALPAAVLGTVLMASQAVIATFPAESGLILFQDQTDDGIQLFTMRPDGTDIRQLTHVEAEPGRDQPGAGRADWSPDGRTIVFNENDCQIRLIDADGSDLREVPPEPGYDIGVDLCEGDASFTPDGRSIVYGRYDGQTEHIWMVGSDGTDRRLVTDACGIDPNVSPDGTRLSCKADGLMAVNLDGSGAMQISPTLNIAFKHDWAPDGGAVVFSDDSDDSSPRAINIVTVAPDGTDLRYLTDVEAGSHAYIGSYSPDGASIVYRVDRGDEHALFVMAADGSDVRQVTEFGAFRPRYLDWGPAPPE